MPILDIFSKRRKQQSQGSNPKLIYTELPDEFRVQVIYIMKRALNLETRPRYDINLFEFYKIIHDFLAEEFGLFALSVRHADDHRAALFEYFLSCEWDQALDIIEVVFRAFNVSEIQRIERGFSDDGFRQGILDQLDERFREHHLGYRFDGRNIVQVDSEYTYSELIQPALKLLSDPRYKAANEEFMQALKFHRHGDEKACLVECYKAFESTLKIICAKRQWRPNGDKVSHLVKTCLNNGLLPGYLTKYFDGVEKTLEGGISPLRNETSGHGLGSTPSDVPAYLVRYGLNVTASAILLLVEADQALDKRPKTAH